MTIKKALVAIAAIGFLASIAGCPGPYVPVKNGACKQGREWVPPVKTGEKWKAGYCKNS